MEGFVWELLEQAEKLILCSSPLCPITLGLT
jgi:hypothetical protein